MTTDQLRVRVVRNWATTVIGILIMLGALAMFIANRIPTANVDFKLYEMIVTVCLGWLFLMGKNSLIEAVTMGLFKVKSKED